METGEAQIAGRNHPRDELEDWYRARLQMDGQGFRDQLLEAGLFQHGGHRKQPAIAGQIVCFKVIARRSPNFIWLPNRCRNSLIDRWRAAMLTLHCSPFGGLLGIGS